MTHARWQQLTEWPLAIVAAVFLATYAWEVIADLQGADALIAEIIIWSAWAIFLADYLVNLSLAGQRWRWFRTHLLDLAIVVLPMLRPLRLLRLVTILSILQRTAGTAFRGRLALYVVGAASLLVLTAALAVLDSERHAAGASITTFGNALWWAFVTISTVGYGDFVPVTELGRLIAVALMIGGLALLGVVTATFASWIVERVQQTEHDARSATRGQIKELAAQIERLQRTVDAQRRDAQVTQTPTAQDAGPAR